MKCWNCGKDLEPFPFNKLPFRAECPYCLSSLHCCKNCIYYKIGMPNDCQVPGTEFVADREKQNLCEDFKVLGKGQESKVSPEDVAKRLFGTTDENTKKIDPKDKFNSLFNP